MSNDDAGAAEVSLSGETAKATVAKFMMAAAGFAGTVFFARTLGPVGFGGFYLLFSLVKITDRPIAGLAKAGQKRFSEVESEKDEIFGAQLVSSFVWTVVAVLVAIVAAKPLRLYTGLQSAPLLFGLLLVAVGLFEPLDKLVKARGKVGIATWVDAGRSYLTLPLQVGFVLAGFGAAGMAYGLAGATLLMVPVMWYLVGIKVGVPGRETLESIWAFARYSIPNAVLGKAYADFDRVILGLLLTPGAVGLYEVAAQLTLPATFVAAVAAEGLLSRVSNLDSRDEDVAQDVTNTLAFTSLLSIPLFFGALAIPRPVVVTIYGGEYAEAGLLLVGLALYRVIRTQRGPLSRTLEGVDRPGINMRISAVTLAINIICGVVLVLEMGVVGVVIATVLAESLQYLLTATFVRRALPEISFVPRPQLQQFGAGAVMFVIVDRAHAMFPVETWVHLGALLALGGATYFGILLLVSRQFRTTVHQVLEDLAMSIPM